MYTYNLPSFLPRQDGQQDESRNGNRRKGRSARDVDEGDETEIMVIPDLDDDLQVNICIPCLLACLLIVRLINSTAHLAAASLPNVLY